MPLDVTFDFNTLKWAKRKYQPLVSMLPDCRTRNSENRSQILSQMSTGFAAF